MKKAKIDDILDVIDAGLQHSSEPSYGNGLPDVCWHCNNAPAGKGASGVCSSCREELLGEKPKSIRTWHLGMVTAGRGRSQLATEWLSLPRPSDTTERDAREKRIEAGRLLAREWGRRTIHVVATNLRIAHDFLVVDAGIHRRAPTRAHDVQVPVHIVSHPDHFRWPITNPQDIVVIFEDALDLFMPYISTWDRRRWGRRNRYARTTTIVLTPPRHYEE